MREINKIYNENCIDTIKDISEKSVDVILTSPFYGTSRKSNTTLVQNNIGGGYYPYMRYDTPVDNMTDREYLEFTTELFTGFDKILKSNGVVIYNINYGNENAELLFKTINEIIEKTPFTIGDVIVWKKTNALPNCHSNNKTTRIWEFVFIFCRDTEYNTFNSNKKAVGKHDTGQLTYENIFNFVEAKNNDGPCPFNKATYSSELCKKLLLMYAPKNAVVYDPFMGTGTTAIACYQLSLNYIGSEISAKQCEWANNRINEEMAQIRFEI